MTRRDMRRKVCVLVKTRCFFQRSGHNCKAYGVTQTAAVLMLPVVGQDDIHGTVKNWQGILAKPRVAIDYAYVSTRKVASGRMIQTFMYQGWIPISWVNYKCVNCHGGYERTREGGEKRRTRKWRPFKRALMLEKLWQNSERSNAKP